MPKFFRKKLKVLHIFSDGSLLLRNDLKSLKDCNKIILTDKDLKSLQSRFSYNFSKFSNNVTNNIYKKKYFK
jgi:hypothetical protein